MAPHERGTIKLNCRPWGDAQSGADICHPIILSKVGGQRRGGIESFRLAWGLESGLWGTMSCKCLEPRLTRTCVVILVVMFDGRPPEDGCTGGCTALAGGK